MNTLTYHLARRRVVILTDHPDELKKKLPGFDPFFRPTAADDLLSGYAGLQGEPLMQFIARATPHFLSLLLPASRELIHRFEIEAGHCLLSRDRDHYFFCIEDPGHQPRLMLQMTVGSPVVRCSYLSLQELPSGYLRFSLWMALSFTGLQQQTAPVHSSAIIYRDRAVLFLGDSGTGKSTHTRLWLNSISGCKLLNDDSPLIQPEEADPSAPLFAYGSPWSGKGRCYLNARYPVAAFVRLVQAPENGLTKLGTLASFCALYPSFPPAFMHDLHYFNEQITGFISGILINVPVYQLRCLPDQSAAELVKETLFPAIVTA